MPRALKVVFVVVAVSCYPAALWFGLTRWSARAVGAAALALAVPRALYALARAHPAHRRAALRVPAVAVAAAALAMLLDDARALLAMPALINASLLAVFASSLRGPTPLVEHFARMEHPDLSDAERTYCRRVTIAWSAFFALNAAACAALALWAPLRWWALYTGVIAYALVGVMFAAELTVRKWSFRRYGAGALDRVYAWFFPPRGRPS